MALRTRGEVIEQVLSARRSVALIFGTRGAQMIECPASGAFYVQVNIFTCGKFFIAISASNFFQDTSLVLGFGCRRDGDGPWLNAGGFSGRWLMPVLQHLHRSPVLFPAPAGLAFEADVQE